MIKSMEKSGRTVDEALRAALAELGLDVDDISYSYRDGQNILTIRKEI